MRDDKICKSTKAVGLIAERIALPLFCFGPWFVDFNSTLSVVILQRCRWRAKTNRHSGNHSSIDQNCKFAEIA